MKETITKLKSTHSEMLYNKTVPKSQTFHPATELGGIIGADAAKATHPTSFAMSKLWWKSVSNIYNDATDIGFCDLKQTNE